MIFRKLTLTNKHSESEFEEANWEGMMVISQPSRKEVRTDCIILRSFQVRILWYNGFRIQQNKEVKKCIKIIDVNNYMNKWYIVEVLSWEI